MTTAKSMFLVMLSCSFDDIPIRLFPTREAAEEFVSEQIGIVPDYIADRFNRDWTEPVSYWIVEFDAEGLLEDAFEAKALLFAD